jgi:hypothetical protein
VKAVILKNLFGRKMLLPVSVKQLDEGGQRAARRREQMKNLESPTPN